VGYRVWGTGVPGRPVWYSGDWFRAMRWLMIVLLASLAALLLAAAGVARHIWMQRSQLRSNPEAGPAAGKGAKTTGAASDVEEIDPEIEL